MTLSSLAPSSEYTITVVAVDSLGAISQPSAALEIDTAPPTPTHGDVQAYVLASTDRSFEDLVAHYQQVGVIYPTYYECAAGGAITGEGDALITDWARARAIAVMPRINCQNASDEDQILNEPAVMQSTIDEIAAMCEADGYAGVQIDFEGAAPSERNPFTAFITALAQHLHARGDKLSTVVTAKYYNIMSGRAAMYDDAALSVASDYIVVLDWGLHWTTSAPGSIDELPWFTKIADYTATLPNKAKFVIAMPLYGLDWPDGGGPQHPATALEFNAVVALESELGIVPEWESTAQSPHFSYVDGEGVRHEVWYVDRQSLQARAAVATSLGMGVGLWRLGNEDQSIWELPALGGEG
jgi:spore germination protein YaaH